VNESHQNGETAFEAVHPLSARRPHSRRAAEPTCGSAGNEGSTTVHPNRHEDRPAAGRRAQPRFARLRERAVRRAAIPDCRLGRGANLPLAPTASGRLASWVVSSYFCVKMDANCYTGTRCRAPAASRYRLAALSVRTHTGSYRDGSSPPRTGSRGEILFLGVR